MMTFGDFLKSKKQDGFAAWMAKVNAALAKQGLDYRDLPDQPYRDWYEDGVRPASAAKRAIKGLYE